MYQMRHQIIKKSLYNLPFSSIIIKYDYFIEGIVDFTLRENDNLLDIVVVSQDEILCTTSKSLKLYNLKNKSITPFKDSGNITHLKLLSDKRIITYDTKYLKMWELTNFECPEHVFTHHTPYAYHIPLIKDIHVLPNNTLALYGNNNVIKIWDLHMEISFLDGHTQIVTCIYVLPNGKLVSGSKDNTLKIWNLSTYECEHTLIGHTREILTIGVIRDMICSTSEDATIRLWSYTECIKVIKCKLHIVKTLNCGNKLFCLDRYNTKGSAVKVWNIDTEIRERLLKGNKCRIIDIQLLPNDQIIGSSGEGFIIWHLTRKTRDSEWTSTTYLNNFKIRILPDGTIVGISQNYLFVWR